MDKVLIINASYRNGGITDQAMDVMKEFLISQNLEVEEIRLRDHPIEFCLNCRECTQEEGESPGKCVIDDNMKDIVEKIEDSKAFIFSSPTNFFTVTALFKRFLERLTVYGFWKWGRHAPTYRKKSLIKKAIVVSSCAAPSILGRIFYNSLKILKLTAKTVGARVVESVFLGLVSDEQDKKLSSSQIKDLQKSAKRLL